MSSTGGKKPSVTLVSQVFTPDSSANSTILSELAVGLADRGVDVTVITTQPSYTEEDRATDAPKREVRDGVAIRRLPATRFDRQEGIAKRMCNELSFFLVAFFYLLGRRPGDVLLLPTAPTFLPLASWPLRLRGYQPVPIVMDLYPAMAVELGYLSPGSRVADVWEWLNRRAYRRAVETVTIGDSMADELRNRYGDIPVTVIHNWEDGEFITPMDKSENDFAREHGFGEVFTILYSGNLGQHHDLESLVEAADKLEGEGVDDFEFVFIGEGGKKSELQARSKRLDLDSVRFLPYQPFDKLPQSLTSADVAVVTMAKGVEGLCVSSKLYSALASGQAVLAITTPDTEVARVVKRTGCGIHVEPDNPEAVAEAVRKLKSDAAAVDRMGTRAREVFESEFEQEVAIDAYERLVRDLGSSKPR
ncbi:MULTISPECIES: glycosyltransferase family 4 protein [Haloarcula]|uniref:glycosyltransferase family 4 protein n=1 Tax=Haloarcula TaxID=2237 RepID=UPI0023E7A1BE|nr:glycosyltransferase family 4 protein [Halomicroarcula sp. SHR3]